MYKFQAYLLLNMNILDFISYKYNCSKYSVFSTNFEELVSI